MDGNLVGGIIGGVLGTLGGVVGTYFGIRNTDGPRERAFVVKGAVLCWTGVLAFLAFLVLAPSPWNLLAWLLYGPVLWWFQGWARAGQKLARAGDAPPGGGVAAS